MIRILSLLALLAILIPDNIMAQTVNNDKVIGQLQEGDIVFQKIPCGDLCDAIIETTPCMPGRMFNHCGIIHFEKQKAVVIEAIGKQVKETMIDQFLKRDPSPTLFVGRLKENYRNIITTSVQKAASYVGRPYDNKFLPGDTALYCSELVYESYKTNKADRIFSLKPMTFKSPKTNTTYPAWASYYKDISTDIPEGLPGINPCAIANDEKVILIMLMK